MSIISAYEKKIREKAGTPYVQLKLTDGSLTLPMSVSAAAEYLYNDTKPPTKVMPSEEVTEQLDKAYSASVAKSAEEKLITRRNLGATNKFYLDLLGIPNLKSPENIAAAPTVAALSKNALKSLSKIAFPFLGVKALYEYINDVGFPSSFSSNREFPEIDSYPSNNSAPSTPDYGNYSSSSSATNNSTTSSPAPSNPEPLNEDPNNKESKKGRVGRALDELRKPSNKKSNKLPNNQEPKKSFTDRWKSHKVLGYPARHPFISGIGIGSGIYSIGEGLKDYKITILKKTPTALSPDTKAKIDSLNREIDRINATKKVSKEESVSKEEEPDSITSLLLGL